jgi:hypothetical protein
LFVVVVVLSSSLVLTLTGKLLGSASIALTGLKVLGEGGLKILTKLMNTIYDTGEWPKGLHRSYNDCLKEKDKVLLTVSEQRNILHEIRKRKANWIGHILRTNCLLKEVIEGKIKGQKEVTRRRGRRRKKLLDDLGERRGYSHLKEEALNRIKWRNRFGRGCGPVVCLTVY